MNQLLKNEVYQYSWIYLTFANNAEKENRRFVKSNIISPYMEINTAIINDYILKKSDNHEILEVNPFVRYSKIYDKLFKIGEEENVENFKESLFNLTFHFLTNLDLYEGLTKKDIFCKRIVEEIEQGIFGNTIKKNMRVITKNDQLIIAELIYNNYENKSTIESFKDSIFDMFSDSIVYDNLFSSEQIIVYINAPKTSINKAKFKIIVKLFLPLGLKSKVFWRYHFGIVDNPETLKIGEVAIF